MDRAIFLRELLFVVLLVAMVWAFISRGEGLAIATVAFGVLGAALGSVFGPMGTQIGFSVGTLVGSALEAQKAQPQDAGPLTTTNSAFGVTIPQIWGTVKIQGGNLIWWSDFRDRTHSQGSGKPRVTTYEVDLAIMWCEGPITEIVRIWANDTVIWDIEAVPPLMPDSITNYEGTATQTKDATMVAALTAAQTPAYRYRAYTVFDNFDLGPYGNGMPNFRALVRKSAATTLAADDFNRADGNAGVSSSGHTWQWTGVQPQVLSNRGISTSSPNNPAYIECGTANVQVQLTQSWTGSPITGSGFITFRLTDDSNYLSFGDKQGFGPGFYQLLKKEAGVSSALATTAVASANGDVIKVIANGASIKCSVNGVEVVSTTSSFNQTATKHGWSAEASAGVDDWSAQTVADGTVPLSAILEDVSGQVGIDTAQMEFAAADDLVRGLKLESRGEARGFLQTFVPLYFVDVIEVDGKIRAVPRGGASVATLETDEFGAVELSPGDSESEPPIRLPGSRRQDYELPQAIEILYASPANNYEEGHQRAFRVSKSYLDETVTLNTPLVLLDNEARQIADRYLWSVWAEQQSWEGLTLPVRALLAPADPVTLVHEGVQYRCRIDGQTLSLPGFVSLRLVAEEEEAILQDGAGQAPVGGFTPVSVTAASLLVAWNGNAAFDEDADLIGLYWVGAPAGAASYWPGAALYLSRDGGSSYQLIDQTIAEGTFGVTASALAAGTQTAMWDDTYTVDVTLAAGADTVPPETRSDAEVIAGENGCLIGNEYVQFGTVTNLGGGVYRLSHLVRGRRGTDAFWAQHYSGERVVFDDNAVRRVDLSEDLYGSTVLLKLVGAGQTTDDVSSVSVTIYGRELSPYAPVLLAGTRDGSNNLSFTWRRRTRIGGEWVSGVDAPLGEEVEEYHLRALSNTATNITAVTRSTSTAKTVIAAAGHGLVAGDMAYVSGAVGILPLNGMLVTVTSVSGANVTVEEPTTDFPAYVSGGTLRKVVRTITTTTTSASYLAATQVSDGFTPPNPISFVVTQVGSVSDGYTTLAPI